MRKNAPRRFLLFDFKNKRVAIVGPGKAAGETDVARVVEAQRQFAASSSAGPKAS